MQQRVMAGRQVRFEGVVYEYFADATVYERRVVNGRHIGNRRVKDQALLARFWTALRQAHATRETVPQP